MMFSVLPTVLINEVFKTDQRPRYELKTGCEVV